MSNQQQPDTLGKLAAWLERVGLIVALISTLATVVLTSVDTSVSFIWGTLGVACFSGLGWLWARARALPNVILRSALLLGGGLTMVGVTAGIGYFVWSRAQPRFLITALNTLERDADTYEVTDLLILNRDNLAAYGVETNFAIQVVPQYSGREQFGRVSAVITGPGGGEPIRQLLWDDFTEESPSVTFTLSLTDVLRLSSLKTNDITPANILQPDQLPSQESWIRVAITREGAQQLPWPGEHQITIRNTPWDLRSLITVRDGQRVVDLLVRNRGGRAEFRVKYNLVRLEGEVGLDDQLMQSGTTDISVSEQLGDVWTLERGESFTATVVLPNLSEPGRYMVEVAPVKRQPYASFTQPGVTWDNLRDQGAWWWFSGRFDRHMFIVPTQSVDIDAQFEGEHRRLREQQIVDLGKPMSSAEDVVSAKGTLGRRQVFADGTIYAYDGKLFTLYGKIFEYYQQNGAHNNRAFGFPTSPIESVQASTGTKAEKMEFEGLPDQVRSAIYASEKNTVVVMGSIAAVYLYDLSGHSGWLGLPVSDEQYSPESTITLFEKGYIVYPTPRNGEEFDWSKPTQAYPYLGSVGDVVDVAAGSGWQATGFEVREGEQLTILQMSGAWSFRRNAGVYVDGNGLPADPALDQLVLVGAPAGSLIARFGGEGGVVLNVGRSATITAPRGGVVELAINDASPDDNDGSILVQIFPDPIKP